MPKFSIIIPVYNTAKYLTKCLDSIFNQSFQDYEIIIVNDGSTDDSDKIIKKLIKNKQNIKYIIQENKGQSIARNIGVKSAIGDYILFVDSDDYINEDLLLELSKQNSDVIRYQASFTAKNKTTNFKEKQFYNLSGIQAFYNITKYHYVDVICLYAYNRKFYIKNNYKFAPGLYHEDFGLIPRILVEASTVTSIPYVGYNYIERNNSIMTTNNYQKTRKKAFDMIEHYKYLNSSEINDKVYKSFVANSVILKARDLKKEDFKIYVKKLKELKVFENVLDDTIIRKFKKTLMKINLKLYLKVIK